MNIFAQLLTVFSVVYFQAMRFILVYGPQSLHEEGNLHYKPRKGDKKIFTT